MRGSFVHHSILKKRKVCRKICLVTAALLASVCLLSACGPEPGAQNSTEQNSGGTMFGGPDTGEEPGGRPEGSSAEGISGNGTAETGSTNISGGNGGEDPSASATSALEDSMISRPIQGEITRTDAQTLEALQDYLNEDSSYGFLLSSYDIPEDIDLNQVFYSGAGFAQEGITDEEKELLLERIPQEEIRIPVIKVTDDQIEELLGQKAGISYEDCRKPLTEEDGWARIGRYNARYALRGDTNRKYIQCTDAWQQGNVFIVHYQLKTKAPETVPAASTQKNISKADTGSQEETEAKTASTAEEAAADTADTAETETASAAEETAAEDTAEDTVADTAEDTAAAASAAEDIEAVISEDTAAAASAAENTAADTAAEAAEAKTAAENAQEFAKQSEAEEENALYDPTYEVQLEKTGDGYKFCYNIVWVQKDLIEAQSYRAELKPAGEVFFAPFYPDTEKDAKADVTFALVKDKAILDILSPMEKDNIRTDLVFSGVDAVDFTDYNKDGCTDILTVCSYTKVSEDGRKSGTVREARVYSGQEDAVPRLDMNKTKAVNRDVEVLNITNVTNYLTGKSDGTAKKYSSWKEAYADHIEGLDTDEYDGFALIYLNEDRTPELVQVGATTAKGASIVVYRSGTLDETWLNRRDFRYLEYENLLYSPSGVENLHFDTIYSITGGKLGISTQGYYGNSSLARVRFDENGKEVWDYYWEGGEVSESGYRDGLNFIFDGSRAKTCDEEVLLTAEELLEQLK